MSVFGSIKGQFNTWQPTCVEVSSVDFVLYESFGFISCVDCDTFLSWYEFSITTQKHI